MLYVNPIATPYSAGLDSMAQSDAREKVAFEEFEQFFLYTLLHEMRESITHEGIWGEGTESRVYTEMLDDALSKEMAKSGQFGLAEAMANQLHAAEVQDSTRPGSRDLPAAVKS